MTAPTTLILRGSLLSSARRQAGRRRVRSLSTWSNSSSNNIPPPPLNNHQNLALPSALLFALAATLSGQYYSYSSRTSSPSQENDDAHSDTAQEYTRKQPTIEQLHPYAPITPIADDDVRWPRGFSFKTLYDQPSHLSTTQCEHMQQQQQQQQQKRQTTNPPFMIKTRATMRIEECSTRGDALESKYDVNWTSEPLGEGAFGTVHLATDKHSKQKVAVKKISKKFTTHDCFQREMNALLVIKAAGGHPNICALREYFDFSDHYTLILDFIGGGEMFDHLVGNGAYSEADAARLIREVASAVAFLHGINVVHADLKPENLMLSTARRADAVVKLVDFGCAKVVESDDDEDDLLYDDIMGRLIISDQNDKDQEQVTPRPKASQRAITPAYCPPECFQKNYPVEAPMDMWSLGVIIFIMLTGRHPFDLNGDSSDKEVERRIKRPHTYNVPLRGSDVTAHLSDSAIDLIEKLLERDASKRLTATEMLEHPWVRGETATGDIIAGSDTRLNKFRKYKSKLQVKFFQNAVDWSDQADDEATRKTSLIERYFQSFDRKKQGVVTGSDLGQHLEKDDADDNIIDEDDGGPTLSMSDFHSLLADSMKHRYFPKGRVIYREGEIGNAMYFINSGAIEVTTKDGTRATRKQGDFFGEGALLHPDKKRSATIRCKTPVHAIEINRSYFEKYIASSETGLLLTLREKDKIRKRNRAKTVLRLQKNLTKIHFNQGEYVFSAGDAGDAMYVLEKGKVDIMSKDKCVFSVLPGNVLGEYSLLMDQPRNVSAVCVSENGCVAHKLMSGDFRLLRTVSPGMYESLSELRRRRDFKKAVVHRLKKEFPYNDPREAFEAIDTKKHGYLDENDVASLLRDMDPKTTEEEIRETMKSLDLSSSGTVSFDEFRKVFVADVRTSASM